MADIRALMAQERQARRINHEFASYTKSGALMCSACSLNIKAESLWDGHLRSTNHKNNVKRLHEASRTAAKRKIQDVDDVEVGEDLDARKKLKPKTRTPSQTTSTPSRDGVSIADAATVGAKPTEEGSIEAQEESEQPNAHLISQPSHTRTVPLQEPTASVDEDEWAAFERDVAPLAKPDYSAATITAAPVTAAQLEEEAESDRRKLRDTEADDEKEEEGRRIEEEFDVMEEMEERVKKLKEKREALRLLGRSEADTEQPLNTHNAEISPSTGQEAKEENDDSDEEDIDDWYS